LDLLAMAASEFGPHLPRHDLTNAGDRDRSYRRRNAARRGYTARRL